MLLGKNEQPPVDGDQHASVAAAEPRWRRNAGPPQARTAPDGAGLQLGGSPGAAVRLARGPQPPHAARGLSRAGALRAACVLKGGLPLGLPLPSAASSTKARKSLALCRMPTGARPIDTLGVGVRPPKLAATLWVGLPQQLVVLASEVLPLEWKFLLPLLPPLLNLPPLPPQQQPASLPLPPMLPIAEAQAVTAAWLLAAASSRSFRNISRGGSSSHTQGCLRTSAMVILVAGSIFSIRRSRSPSAGDTCTSSDGSFTVLQMPQCHHMLQQTGIRQAGGERWKGSSNVNDESHTTVHSSVGLQAPGGAAGGCSPARCVAPSRGCGPSC